MNLIYYDIEVAKNGWMITFIKQESQEVLVFSYFPDLEVDERRGLWDFIKTLGTATLCGYNNAHYDDIILGYLISTKLGANVNNEQYLHSVLNVEDPSTGFFNLSKAIIDRELNWRERRRLTDVLEANTARPAMDVMAVFNLKVSLKKIEASMGLPIMELPFDPEVPIDMDTYVKVVPYNIHDVYTLQLISERMWWALGPRFEIEAEFGIPAQRMSDPAFAKAYMRRQYTNLTGSYIPSAEVRRQEVNYIWNLGDAVYKDFEFTHPAFQEVYEKILNWGTYTYRDTISFDPELNGTYYTVRTGGLHTVDTPRVFRSDDKHVYMDIDFGSYYPGLKRTFGLYPQHLDREALSQILSTLIVERLLAKREGRTGYAAGLKIVLNAGMYGLLDDEWFGYRDPEMRLAICLNGQLLLMELCNKFEDSGISVISANTDGVTVKMPRNLGGTLANIMRETYEKYHIPLEATPFVKGVQTSISDYAIEKDTYMVVMDHNGLAREETKGGVKRKGRFSDYTHPAQSVDMPVVYRSVEYAFLNDGEETVVERAEKFIRNQGPNQFYTVQAASRGYHYAFGKDASQLEHIGRVVRFFPGGDEFLYRIKDPDEVLGHVLLTGVTRANEIPEEVPEASIQEALSRATDIIMSVLGISAPKPLQSSNSRWTMSDITLQQAIVTLGAYREGSNNYRADLPYGEHNSSRHVQFWMTDKGIRFKLHGKGMTLTEFMERLRKDVAAGVRREPRKRGMPLEEELTITYVYKDHKGNYVCSKNRFENGEGGKTFRMMDHKGPDGGRKHVPPYRVNEWYTKPYVVLCEGEKDADTLSELGIPATTLIDHRLERYNLWYFEGKSVIIIPDNDTSGIETAAQAASRLSPIVKSLHIHEWSSNTPKGFDVTNYRDVYGPDALSELIKGYRRLDKW